ncbi:MAG: tRNA threonylcarbamoyladenosine dehydratase [Clostridia bacterium]|nr:tRNA threonylcarbamoyladenosine dehydratase [Clostridia bacterium]
MKEQFIRTAYVIGNDAVERLRNARVILFGVGGVGSYCAEALARAGVGTLTLVDADDVSVSNINRQLLALHSTVGRKKTEVMKERIADINPEASVTALSVFYLPENADAIDLSGYDIILDAIDTVSAKIELAVRAKRLGIPMISAMGTGNKLHPELLEATDISKTQMCPLARVMRRELKARGVDHLRVVYSTEVPIPRHVDYAGEPDMQPGAKRIPGSVSFVPSAAGLLMASEAIRLLTEPSL